VAHIRFWCEKQRERDHLEDLGVEEEDNIKMDLSGMGRAWTGLIWLRIGTGGSRHL
jgi:hypothetical protein